jgi:cbb3-type cytochrome oxidase subunit 3
MSFYSDIKRSWPIRQWKRAGNRERASWIVLVGVPAMIAWFDLYERLPKDSIYFIATIILFLLSGFVIILNASLRGERDEAKLGLIKERDASSNAVEKVYAQKNKEIDELKINNDQVREEWKKAQQEIDSLRENCIKADIETNRACDKRIKEKRERATQLLQSEREKFNVDRDKLVSASKWLLDELNSKRERVIESGETYRFKDDEVQTVGYAMGGTIIDDRTLGEKRFAEIETMLKKI